MAEETGSKVGYFLFWTGYWIADCHPVGVEIR